MPSKAAMAAQAQNAEEDANPLEGASQALLLATASDIVQEVADKNTFFSPERSALFPQFEESGMLPKIPGGYHWTPYIGN